MKLLNLILTISLVIYIQSNCDYNEASDASECFLDSELDQDYDDSDYCCYKSGQWIPITSEKYEEIKSDNTYICNQKSLVTTCEDISPSKSSDCVFSSKEKGKICCYYEYEGKKGCSLFEDNDELEEAKKDYPSANFCFAEFNKVRYLSLIIFGLLLISN